MRAFRFFLMTLVLLVTGQVARAQLPTPGRNAMAVTLVPEADVVVAGGTVRMALVMKPDKGWHGYWKNPGDAGAEPRIAWTLPRGATAGPLAYPVPDRLVLAGLMNYVYERDYALMSSLTVPSGVTDGTRIPIKAKLDYLVCTDQVCVPESATVSAQITVGASTSRGPAAAVVDRYFALLPKPLGSAATFQVDSDRIRIGIPFPKDVQISDVYFYPLNERAILHSAPQTVRRSGDLLIVETAAGEGAASLAGLDGVLKIGPEQGLSLGARPGSVPRLPADPAGDGKAIILALLGAILGGLILNIMPCVFPILSLKAISLAKAGGDETTVRREALAYTVGVVLVCLALGGALLAVRAGGATVGWAFQLQDPRVILFLLLLITAIALNLAGLFELPSFGAGDRLTKSRGAAGAFWTGALAAFVATPCTGPFMGLALGAALVLPTAAALAIFAGLGLGLALPFLLLGFVPALRRRLPKPGPWMNRFRRVMSVPMFLTALGLAWILSRQAGMSGLLIGTVAVLILASGLWLLGRSRTRPWLPLGGVAAAAVAGLLLLPSVPDAAAAAPASLPGAEAFSEARLEQLRREGRPVFVYFTADWCLTCKVNEKGVLAREDVADSFESREVAILVGDWTSGDPVIGRFLEKHGRSGVPLYLYYPAGQPPRILSQILTPSELLSLR